MNNQDKYLIMLLVIFLVFLRISANSFSGVFQKKLADNISVFLINFISYFILAIFSLIAIIIYNAYFNSDFDFNRYLTLYSYFDFSLLLNLTPLAFLIGFVGAIGNAFQIKALEYGELSVLAPINSYKIIFSLIFSYFLLGEVLNFNSFIGVILIIFGTFLLFNTSSLSKKGVMLRILAVFFTALEAIFIKKLILLSDSLIALFLWALFSSLFSLLFFLLKTYKINNIKSNKFNFKIIKNLIFLSLTMGLMQLSTNILFKMMNVGACLCLFQLSCVLSVFLGYKIFKEKNLIKKLIASVIMVLGACVIILNV